MRRREFITLLGGAYGGLAARGARAATGEAADHRVSGSADALPPRANGSPLLCSGCANSAGSRAAPSRSSFAGRRDAASASPRSPPSSSGSRSMSLSRRDRRSPRSKAGDVGHPDRLRDGGGPGWHWPCRESWRDRAATSPACRSSRPILPASVSNSCARLFPVSVDWRSWPMPAIRRSRAGDGRSSGSGPHARLRGHRIGNPASGGYRARL